jgi:hypothetical protein
VRNETPDEIDFEICPPIISSHHDMSSDMSGDRTNEIRVSHFIRRLMSHCVFRYGVGHSDRPCFTPPQDPWYNNKWVYLIWRRSTGLAATKPPALERQSGPLALHAMQTCNIRKSPIHSSTFKDMYVINL